MDIHLLACLLCTVLLIKVTNSSAENVKVTTTPIFPQISRDHTSKDFQVLVRVEAPPPIEKKHLPLDLVVVVHVSSINRLDIVKKAMNFVIRQLHNHDRLAVLEPSNTRQATLSEISGGGRNSAQKEVDELQASGDADDISGLLREAAKILLERREGNRARSIILVTDGDIVAFNKEYPVPVHTLGFRAAHNSVMLSSISQESRGGTYSFVDDDDDEDLTGAFAVLLGGVKTVVAVDTHIHLRATSGVTIEGMDAGGYDSLISNGKAFGDIFIGMLYDGEVKNFIVHLHVPAAPAVAGDNAAGCDQQQLLTVTCQYRGNEVTAVETSPVVLLVQRPSHAVDAVHKVPFPAVVHHIVQFEVLKIVSVLVEKYMSAISVSKVEQETAIMELLTDLQAQWESFVHVHQFWAGLDLNGFQQEMGTMLSSLEGSEVAYIFSWLSSYRTQRPAVMGSTSHVVAAFITLEINIMLHQTLLVANNDHGGGCKDHCAEQPPPMFEQSGEDDDTYRLNEAYKDLSMDRVNEFMKQMYLAVMRASNLKECHSTGAGFTEPPAAAHQEWKGTSAPSILNPIKRSTLFSTTLKQ